jgi:hypothetical protein
MGFFGLLNPTRVKEAAKEALAPGTPEGKAKMLGKGQARQAADAILNRKKQIDSVFDDEPKPKK